MSSFIAKVLEIKNCESLHIVKFDFHGKILSMMSLDLNANVKVGVNVKLIVKPTHVLLAKSLNAEVSSLNRLHTNVISVKNGELLSSIGLNIFESELESIITREVSNAMDIKVGDKLIALIQESELSIGEILND